MRTTYKKGVYKITFNDGRELLRVAKTQKDAKELFKLCGCSGYPVDRLYIDTYPLGYGVPDFQPRTVSIVEIDFLEHSEIR